MLTVVPNSELHVHLLIEHFVFVSTRHLPGPHGQRYGRFQRNQERVFIRY
jgi:hypothetical protein